MVVGEHLGLCCDIVFAEDSEKTVKMQKGSRIIKVLWIYSFNCQPSLLFKDEIKLCLLKSIVHSLLVSGKMVEPLLIFCMAPLCHRDVLLKKVYLTERQ